MNYIYTPNIDCTIRSNAILDDIAEALKGQPVKIVDRKDRSRSYDEGRLFMTVNGTKGGQIVVKVNEKRTNYFSRETEPLNIIYVDVEDESYKTRKRYNEKKKGGLDIEAVIADVLDRIEVVRERHVILSENKATAAERKAVQDRVQVLYEVSGLRVKRNVWGEKVENPAVHIFNSEKRHEITKVLIELPTDDLEAFMTEVMPIIKKYKAK